jgi:AmmeMemoRadiSam system protein B
VARTSPRVRPPAVAGSFYPEDPDELRAELASAFASARAPQGDRATPPKALIVPHAGYAYSGPVAASGYQTLSTARESGVRRVVVLGPSHYVGFAGLAISTAEAFTTPLGRVPVEAEARALLRPLPQCDGMDAPHTYEHSIEVQLPFLQAMLGDFALVPLAVGRAGPAGVADVLEVLWGGADTLIVLSTDLSHHLGYETAMARDRRTADAIVAGRHDAIGDGDACGAHPLRGLLVAASRHRLGTSLLDLRNSGDTGGELDSVVGYGAFALR